MLDWLFQGSPPPNANASTVTVGNLPDWYQEYMRSMMGQSSAIAGQDYTQYQGARIQDFSPDQLQAFQNVRDMQGIQDPYNSAAGNMLTQSGNPNLDTAAFNSYLNPYTSGVVDRLGELGARNLNEKLLPQINDTFTGAGQWGSSRNADFLARAVRDQNESTLAAQNQALADSYNQAMNAYGQGQNRQAYSGQALGALGSTVQQEGIKDAAALQDIGQQQQNLDQKSLDTAYQDFLNQRDWGKTQARFMNEVIRGVAPPPATTTQSSSVPGNYNNYSPSALSQIAGAGMGLYGASQSGLFKAKGGRIKRKKRHDGHDPISKVSRGPRIRHALAKKFHGSM